jgi:hypothetical protein
MSREEGLIGSDDSNSVASGVVGEHIVHMSEEENFIGSVDSSSVAGDTVEDVEASGYPSSFDITPHHVKDTNSHEPSLESLFESVHDQVDDTVGILGCLRPYILSAIDRDPESILFCDILRFMDNCISSDDTSCCCTKAQLYAIVAFHNGNQVLLEDYGVKEMQPSIEIQPNIRNGQSIQSDADYKDFIAELEKLG